MLRSDLHLRLIDGARRSRTVRSVASFGSHFCILIVICSPLPQGAYLSQPKTEKESEVGKSALGFTFGVSSMQGWRRSQEDAHIAADLSGGTAVFGVFDGHGGREVSNFAKRHFANALTEQPSYSTDVPASLTRAFHRIDELLEDTGNLPEIEALKKNSRERSEEGEASGAAKGTADGTADDADDGDPEDGDRKVSMKEAVDIFQKLMTIKKMAVAADGEAGEGEARGGGAPPLPSAPAMASRGLASSGAPGAQGAPRACTLPPSHVDAGATAVVAAIRDGQLHVANAGDSRAVLSRRGTAVPLSFDHKPALATELARIDKAGGWVTAQGRINGNLNLSRALGDLKYKGDRALGRHEQMITAEPDVTTHALEQGDEFIVIACDGVWDCMTNQQVCDFVKERLLSMPLDKIAEDILDHWCVGCYAALRGMLCCVAVATHPGPNLAASHVAPCATLHGVILASLLSIVHIVPPLPLRALTAAPLYAFGVVPCSIADDPRNTGGIGGDNMTAIIVRL